MSTPTFTAHRTEDLRLDLLTIRDEPREEFRQAAPEVQLSSSLYTTIRSGGLLKVVDDGTVDWLTTRVRVTYFMNGTEFPRGVFIPATPTGPRSTMGGLRTVELYDKTLVLNEDVIESTYVVEPGAIVTEVVNGLIADVGESFVEVEPSDEAVAAQTAWSPGTTKLAIVNDLLGSINYTSLYATPGGALRALPIVPYLSRTPVWTFDDGTYTGLYLDDFEDEQDLFGVPNKWIGISRSDGQNPALVSVQTNEDPTSRLSFQNRGRWITKISEDIEATSQQTLDSIVQGLLSNAISAARTFVVTHPWLPLNLDDVVDFRNSDHGIASRCRVIKMEENLVLPGVLVTTTLRELVQL